MQTQTTKKQTFSLDQTGSILEWLIKEIDGPNFMGITIYKGEDWPPQNQAFTQQPKKVLKVTVTTECNQ